MNGEARVRHHELQREPLRFEISVWRLRTPRDRQIRAELQATEDGTAAWHRRRAIHSLWWFAAYATHHRSVARSAAARMLRRVRNCWNASSREQYEMWFAYCHETYRELIDSGATVKLGEAMLREQQEGMTRRRAASTARTARSATRDGMRKLAIESARARKARNPALSKSDLARQIAHELSGADGGRVALETVRDWLKDVSL